MDKVDLKSLSLEELENFFVKIGEKKYRSTQVFNYIHKNMKTSISDINVLSISLRDKLKKICRISDISILHRYDSKIDNTKKYLFLLEDGNIIESVAMEYKYGVTACLSTQVGCKMGCSFCASTKQGLIRDLTPAEMLSQIYNIQKDLDIKLSNIVLMGSGEPLDNYDNVIKFLKIYHDEKGQNFSYRNMTLSTCGIVPQIYTLAEERIPITLSISLHSPFDEIRKKIMPIAKKYSIEEILEACKYYIKLNNKRITFEYTLINEVNDRKEDLNQLIRLLKGVLCHVNLINLNQIKEVKYNKTLKNKINFFKNELSNNGISTTVRREMGSDISASCGQLRRKYLQSGGDLKVR